MQASESTPKGRMDGVRADATILCRCHVDLRLSQLIQDQNPKRLPNRGKPEESFSQDGTVNRRAFNEARNTARGSGTGWSGLSNNTKPHFTHCNL